LRSRNTARRSGLKSDFGAPPGQRGLSLELPAPKRWGRGRNRAAVNKTPRSTPTGMGDGFDSRLRCIRSRICRWMRACSHCSHVVQDHSLACGLLRPDLSLWDSVNRELDGLHAKPPAVRAAYNGHRSNGGVHVRSCERRRLLGESKAGVRRRSCEIQREHASRTPLFTAS
jgi:hypothetical protein